MDRWCEHDQCLLPGRRTALKRSPLVVALFVATLIPIAARGRDSCLVHFDVKAIIAMNDARTLRELTSLYHRYAYPDIVAAVVYAVRLRELSSGGGTTAVIAAAPRNAIEFWAAYHAGDDPYLAAQRPELRDVFDRYLADFADVAATTSSASVMRRFLSQSVFSDGEEAEYLAGLNKAVARKNPKLFAQCVRDMRPDERRRICGTTRPCSSPAAP